MDSPCQQVPTGSSISRGPRRKSYSRVSSETLDPIGALNATAYSLQHRLYAVAYSLWKKVRSTTTVWHKTERLSCYARCICALSSAYSSPAAGSAFPLSCSGRLQECNGLTQARTYIRKVLSRHSAAVRWFQQPARAAAFPKNGATLDNCCMLVFCTDSLRRQLQ